MGNHLILEFDALNANEEDFYYVIQHFNYDWTPSILAKTEYLKGIDNQRIMNITILQYLRSVLSLQINHPKPANTRISKEWELYDFYL